MINECIVAGTIRAEIKRDTTKNGFPFFSTKIQIEEPRLDGQAWKTFVPISAFSKQGEQLAQFKQGDMVLLKGRISWTPDGLQIVPRDVMRLEFSRDADEADNAA